MMINNLLPIFFELKKYLFLALFLLLAGCASEKKRSSNLLLMQTTKPIEIDEKAEDTRQLNLQDSQSEIKRETSYSDDLKNYPDPWSDAAAEKKGMNKVEYIHHSVDTNESFDKIVIMYTGDIFLAEQILRENPFIKFRGQLKKGARVRIPISLFRPDYTRMSLRFLMNFEDPLERFYKSLLNRGDFIEKHYQIQMGDTYESIAKKIYGNQRRWKEIILNNVVELKKSKRLIAGKKLRYLSSKVNTNTQGQK